MMGTTDFVLGDSSHPAILMDMGNTGKNITAGLITILGVPVVIGAAFALIYWCKNIEVDIVATLSSAAVFTLLLVFLVWVGKESAPEVRAGLFGSFALWSVIGGLFLLFNKTPEKDESVVVPELIAPSEPKTVEQIVDHLRDTYFHGNGKYQHAKGNEMGEPDVGLLNKIRSALAEIDPYESRIAAFRSVFQRCLKDERFNALSPEERFLVYSKIYGDWAGCVHEFSFRAFTMIDDTARLLPQYYISGALSENAGVETEGAESGGIE